MTTTVAPDSYQLSVVDDGNPVSEQVRLVHEVGRHDDRLSGLVLDQQVPNAPARVGIDSGGRFVQNDHPKISRVRLFLPGLPQWLLFGRK